MIKLKTVECHECGGTGRQPADGVGPLLKAERERLGIGLRQLERAMDISRTYLMDLEKGQRRVTTKLAAVYLEQLQELTNGDHK